MAEELAAKRRVVMEDVAQSSAAYLAEAAKLYARSHPVVSAVFAAQSRQVGSELSAPAPSVSGRCVRCSIGFADKQFVELRHSGSPPLRRRLRKALRRQARQNASKCELSLIKKYASGKRSLCTECKVCGRKDVLTLRGRESVAATTRPTPIERVTTSRLPKTVRRPPIVAAASGGAAASLKRRLAEDAALPTLTKGEKKRRAVSRLQAELTEQKRQTPVVSSNLSTFLASLQRK